MLFEDTFNNSVISLQELFPISTDQFIKPFENVIDPDIHKEMCLDFELFGREKKEKVNPILRLARLEDAEELIAIYKELYNDTYPYKEMTDVREVQKMLQDPNIQWIVYQDPSYNIAGCITFVLDFENMRGYIRGFMLRKKYQGVLDITKAMIGSMIGMIHKFRNKIYIWYVENRTAHSKSQYSMWVCGIAPIGFYPNKDVFLGKVESDLMQICYDGRVLGDLRKKDFPIIIPPVKNCYNYSDNRYNLGKFQVKNPKLALDRRKVSKIKKSLEKCVKKDKFGYETIRFTLPRTTSYFEFLYTPQVQNFEKTEYNVSNLEELYVFVKKFSRFAKEFKIRYCEVFVSAYEPTHQQIFYNAGFYPRGYVPSWKFNKKTQVFEDSILFNWFKGIIDKDIRLIDEGKDLLKSLYLKSGEDFRGVLKEKQLLDKFPLSYCFRDKASRFLDHKKVVRSSLMIGLLGYLLCLLGVL